MLEPHCHPSAKSRAYVLSAKGVEPKTRVDAWQRIAETVVERFSCLGQQGLDVSSSGDAQEGFVEHRRVLRVQMSVELVKDLARNENLNNARVPGQEHVKGSDWQYPLGCDVPCPSPSLTY